MKITEEYLLGDGYDKDVIVYRYNELDEKNNLNKNQHGEKVASYIYPKDDYVKSKKERLE